RQIDAFTVSAPSHDPFALQDSVSRWAVGALALKLDAPEENELSQHGTQVSAAYELYLQGRGYLAQYQKPLNVDTAIELFNRALALDSKYPLAYAGLGAAYWQKYETSREQAWVPQARSACQQSLALGSTVSEAYVCAGTVRSERARTTKRPVTSNGRS